MKIMAVDFRGTHATCALVENKRILARETIDLPVPQSLAAAGDVVSREIVDRCLHIGGAAAVTAIHSFDPELPIYGGGVLKSADLILPFMQGYVSANAWTPWKKVRVRAARLGNDAALLGVVPLFEQELSVVR